MTDIEYIRANMSLPATLEQLAEEYIELAHAALKSARYLRKESPTRETYTDIIANLLEETADVHVVEQVLVLEPNPDTVAFKTQRWADRIRAVAGSDGDEV